MGLGIARLFECLGIEGDDIIGRVFSAEHDHAPALGQVGGGHRRGQAIRNGNVRREIGGHFLGDDRRRAGGLLYKLLDRGRARLRRALAPMPDAEKARGDAAAATQANDQKHHEQNNQPLRHAASAGGRSWIRHDLFLFSKFPIAKKYERNPLGCCS